MNTGERIELVFSSQVFQQLLNSTIIVCLVEVRQWAGRQTECSCSCQKALFILKGQLSQAITWMTSSFPKSPLPFFSYLLNQSFFRRRSKKSLYTLNIGLFISIYCGKTIHRFPLKDFLPCLGTNGLYMKKG